MHAQIKGQQSAAKHADESSRVSPPVSANSNRSIDSHRAIGEPSKDKTVSHMFPHLLTASFLRIRCHKSDQAIKVKITE